MATPPPGWEPFLAPGERILWQGRPLRRADWGALAGRGTLFGLFFAGFAVFWIVQTLRMTQMSPSPVLVKLLFPLAGLPFLYIGLKLSLGPALRPWLALGGTFYTLTDRTAFVARQRFGRRTIQRYPLTAGLRPELVPGTPGTVWFASSAAGEGQWRSTGGSARTAAGVAPRAGFERIAEAETVHRLMVEAAAALGPAVRVVDSPGGNQL